MLSHSRSTKAPRLPATLLNGSCSDGIKVVGACAGPGFTWSVKGEPGRRGRRGEHMHALGPFGFSVKGEPGRLADCCRSPTWSLYVPAAPME
jgi:hypothetical protein